MGVMPERWCGKLVSQLNILSPVCFSVFQSESEQDEESTGSMGSAAVAVSPFISLLL